MRWGLFGPNFNPSYGLISQSDALTILAVTPTPAGTDTPTHTPTHTPTASDTPTLTPSATETPFTADAYAHLVPSGPATVVVGQKFTLDLLVNSGSNRIIGNQSYFTFTNALLQVAPVGNNSCAPANTVLPDTSTFEEILQNEVCNSDTPCTLNGRTVPASSIAFASGTLAEPCSCRRLPRGFSGVLCVGSRRCGYPLAVLAAQSLEQRIHRSTMKTTTRSATRPSMATISCI